MFVLCFLIEALERRFLNRFSEGSLVLFVGKDDLLFKV
ncbi:hypothetical protein Phpb_03252 [Photorhabdus namnaonensis]|uniref:Uncharacterized protein n=1 Tax=Photorhabdus namnaonensis TaxID=1851568 RepID=A0A1B8YF64_9GAMM|nr:hypothetical protein Phpb_03252 [Photorhabdus namnaonensis]